MRSDLTCLAPTRHLADSVDAIGVDCQPAQCALDSDACGNSCHGGSKASRRECRMAFAFTRSVTCMDAQIFWTRCSPESTPILPLFRRLGRLRSSLGTTSIVDRNPGRSWNG